MAELKALEVSSSEDLSSFSRYLWSIGLPHRIIAANDRQLVLVQHPEQIDVIRDLFARQRRGETLPEQPELPAIPKSVLLGWRHVPMTLFLIALSICGFVIAAFTTPLLSWFTYFPYQQHGSELVFSAINGQYWRLLTPIFLHFNLLHIVFNMLWLWELGRRIELAQGSWRLLIIVLIMGIGSNVAQAMFASAAIFGGMSGVDYGLLAYCWLWGWRRPDSILHVPTPVLIAMVVLMLLSMTGFTVLMGAGAVANAAHIGGLLMGFVVGAIALAVAPLLRRSR